jgi:hypothetical protein
MPSVEKARRKGLPAMTTRRGALLAISSTAVAAAPGSAGQARAPAPVPGCGPFSAVGVFDRLHEQTIPADAQMIQTAGFRTPGVGAARYVRLQQPAGARPASDGPTRKRDARGEWWELAEETINVTMFGAVGDGDGKGHGTDNADAFGAAIAHAQTTGRRLIIPAGTYFMGRRGLVLDLALTLEGETRAGVILDFSGLLLGEAIYVGKDGHIDEGLAIKNLRVVGNRRSTGLRVGTQSGATVKDSRFEFLQFTGFGLGLQVAYAWQNVFTNCRWQDCTKPFDLGSQINASHFDTCSFVSFSKAGEFTNAEGVHFTAPNISNITAPVGFTLFQSTVSMDQPYFENVADVIASVGRKTETTLLSGLVIRGGIISGDYIIHNRASLIIEGSRVASARGVKVRQEAPTPQAYVRNLSVKLDSNFYTPAGAALVDITHERIPALRPAFGGAQLAYELGRDAFVISQKTAANGVILASDLVVGRQYTLAYALRRRRGAKLAMKAGEQPPLDLTGATVDDTQAWEIRYMPFVAADPVLRLLLTGAVEVKLLQLYAGIRNTDLALPKVDRWFSAAAPASGGWRAGDIVFNTAPGAGEQVGWIAVGDAGGRSGWRPFGGAVL